MNRNVLAAAAPLAPLALVTCLGSCAWSTASTPSERHGPCLSAQHRVGDAVVSDGGRANVKVGAHVYVDLVEAGRYLSWSPHSKPPPTVFPWLTARSSNTGILRPAALCRQILVSTLPVRTFAFVAAHTGLATIRAELAPAWRAAKPSVRGRLHPYRATVVVTDRIESR